jgi:hypothetical protein
LRFLRKWNGAGTAWLANLIMLLGTIPRCLVWFMSDTVAGLKSGSLPQRRSLLKSRALVFHARALVRPALFYSSWEMDEETSTGNRERT